MEIFSRFLHIARSNWNHWVTQTQDPEVLLEQGIEMLQNEMIELRQAVAQAIATYKRTERQCRQTQQRSQEWYKQAEQAMGQNQENVARDALIQRKLLLDAGSALEHQLEPQQQIVHRLKKDLQTLELKLADAQTRKDLYLVRARSAQATQRTNDLLGRLQSSTGGLFETMEQRVLDLECQADASNELRDLPKDPLESRFASLESPEVEVELEALRKRLRS
ncbi:MAG: PspA/IM30 family protein [Prochlorotrichaceae cyanobacterium]